MKILVVSPVPSDPPTEGNRVCIRSYCNALSADGHLVDFLYSYRPWTSDRLALAAMSAAWPEGLHLHRASPFDRIRDALAHRNVARRQTGYRWGSLCPHGLGRRIRSLTRQHRFDAVIVNYWTLTPAVMRLRGVRRILYAHDSFANRVSRTGNSWFSTDRATETKALESVDAVLAIQDSEAEGFRARTSTPVFTAYSHVPICKIPCGAASNLLFLAGPNGANVEGISGFIADVLPEIRAAFPEMRLIVGGGVCAALGHPRNDAVQLVGEVSNLAAFYERGAICVSPVSRGTGLKIKVIEALAYGRLVLAHPHCLDGLPCAHEAPITPCGSTADWVTAVRSFAIDSEALRREQAKASAYAAKINTMCLTAFQAALSVYHRAPAAEQHV